ncbi:MAG: hypothetical protein EAZ81_06890 [Verrucomicrobia bacterium]|nr:MAG: hypothetical protein EAZ81_06890 [Verrucomicrobiota bacterium]
MHLYERLPLFGTGLVLGLFLLLGHVLLLVKSDTCQHFLKKFPRNQKIGQVLLGIGLLWFWLLVAPPNKGWISVLAMDMTDFNGIKPLLRLLMPLIFVAVAMSITEFLSVRALGLLGLLVAQPLLDSAFLRDPATRLLIPIYTYGLIIASLFFVGMPYLFRDAVTWATAKKTRWNALCCGGISYGIAILFCAFAFWRGQ